MEQKNELPSKSMWIDTHAHIDKLTPGVKEVLRSAKKAGVSRILTIGTELKDWEAGYSDLYTIFSGNLWSFRNAPSLCL